MNEERYEICTDANQAEINLTSNQQWYSFNETKPKWSGDGNWGGRYLCIVERLSNSKSLGYVPGGINKSLEMCYYNGLSNQFQDSNNEYVIVSHWTQIPQMPFYKTQLITRDEMLQGIKRGVLELVSYTKETDEFYQLTNEVDLAHISYNTLLYYSSTRSNHIEDYMYCIKIIKK